MVVCSSPRGDMTVKEAALASLVIIRRTEESKGRPTGASILIGQTRKVTTQKQLQQEEKPRKMNLRILSLQNTPDRRQQHAAWPGTPFVH